MLLDIGFMQIWLSICVTGVQVFITPTVAWLYSVFGIRGGTEPARANLDTGVSLVTEATRGRYRRGAYV
jgi:hypothetical protein